jgi:CrcB protein
MSFLYVAIGGAVGSSLRYALSLLLQPYNKGIWPWPTFVANIFGCFCIGLIMFWVLKSTEMRENMRLLLVTGVLGGFTTFSSFSYETWRLWSLDHTDMAIYYALSSLLACLGATFLAMFFAKQIF